MAGGVIPIVTYESSIDVKSFGVLLEDATVESVMHRVREIAAMSREQLLKMSKRAWECAHSNHTPEKFEHAYRAVIEMLLAKHGKG